MTTADRALAGLILALVVAAPVVRPVWRAIDSGPADFLRACASLRAREPLDPWGSPWIRTPWSAGLGPPFVAPNPPPVPTTFEVGSAGPDKIVGTADDMPMIWYEDGRPESGFVLMPETWYDDGFMDARARTYRASPSVPVALALILLLTRWMSGATRPRAGLAGRATVACALAVVPAGMTLIVCAVSGVVLPGLAAHPVGLVSPAIGVIGSVYLLLAVAIFAHRELHHLQKIEAGADGASYS